MTRSSNWQWSLQSMFALVSACAVMAFWLRFRLAIDPEWVQRRGISISEGLPIACLAVWFAQCIFSPRHSSISPWLTPRCELPAAAILLSGVDTVRSIGAIISCFSPERIKKLLEDNANNNAVLGYSFILSCVLAMAIAMPRARESVRQTWFAVLCVVVSLNIGLVVWFCNWRASQLDLSHR